jgi:hypothetical protein
MILPILFVFMPRLGPLNLDLILTMQVSGFISEPVSGDYGTLPRCGGTLSDTPIGRHRVLVFVNVTRELDKREYDPSEKAMNE